MYPAQSISTMQVYIIGCKYLNASSSNQNINYEYSCVIVARYQARVLSTTSMKRVFVTVGSTYFDELVDVALSSDVLASFRARGVEEVVVQCGSYKGRDNKQLIGLSTMPVHSEDDTQRLKIEVYTYKPNLTDEFMKADMVVSHAGSGTILDVLRLGKPLIVVPNPSLLDNHQQDLATELENLGYLKATKPKTLNECISTFKPDEMKPFPPKDKGKFQAILDDMMGF